MKAMTKLAAALSVAFGGFVGTASADPWKDESGHGKWRSGHERGWDGDREHHRGWSRGRRHGWDRGERQGPRFYDMDRTGSLNCRTTIVRRENEWGRVVTRQIQRCG